MALERLRLILDMQPDGPYRLCGYCNGGIVAIEVARLLLAAGKKVEVDIMVDTPGLNARRSTTMLLSSLTLWGNELWAARAWWYAAKLERFIRLSFSERWTGLIGKTKRLAKLNVEGGNSRAPDFGSEQPKLGAVPTPFRYEYFGYFFYRYAVAFSRYAPKSLAVPIVHLSAEYSGRVWRRISPDVQVIESPGNHYQMIASPEELARQLATILGAFNPECHSERL
jgi:pimeloyl-ACP methyl ester carboxylesterase